MNIEASVIPYLQQAVKYKASDIFFSEGAITALKINGAFHDVGREVLTKETVRQIASSILSKKQLDEFEVTGDLDTSLSREGVGRFRVNVFNQRGSLAMVLRYIRNDLPTAEELGLPPVLQKLIMKKRGMLLMVGATGSGKTTSLAAMINHRNENASGHILTIEDPIEFVHTNKRSYINQREVGVDTASYERALKACLREAPDVILLGEIRTRESMESTMQLANTGHLALSTLHANNAYQALQRIVNLFPEDARNTLYLDLSLTLQAIISQRLVKNKEGNRVAVFEVMLNTPYISDLIKSGRIDEIGNAMEQSSDDGMLTFDQSLHTLYSEGKITLEEALNNSDSRTNLEAKINFG